MIIDSYRSSSIAEDGLEGFVPAHPNRPSADPTGEGVGTEGAGGPLDPTGLPLEEILLSLQQAVAECLDAEAAENSLMDDSRGTGATGKQDPSLLSLDKSLVALGMDSMRGIQLQAVLEARFTVQLPDELMFEPDCTLRTIGNGNSLRRGNTDHSMAGRSDSSSSPLLAPLPSHSTHIRRFD